MFHVEHFAAFLPRNVPHGTFRAHRSAGRSCPHASPSLPAVPGGAVQDSISARGAARLFCLAYRQMKSVPGAALPPRSAPETNTLATRAKCPDHSVRRRTATRPFPRPGPFALRAGQETVHSLRPVPPHRTRRLGHFPRRRKMSVPMRTTCGGPGFASVRWWRTVCRYLPLCLRSPRAVPPACPVRPGAADSTPTSPRRAETRPSPAFVPLLIFRCPCYTVVKITA